MKRADKLRTRLKPNSKSHYLPTNFALDNSHLTFNSRMRFLNPVYFFKSLYRSFVICVFSASIWEVVMSEIYDQIRIMGSIKGMVKGGRLCWFCTFKNRLFEVKAIVDCKESRIGWVGCRVEMLKKNFHVHKRTPSWDRLGKWKIMVQIKFNSFLYL